MLVESPWGRNWAWSLVTAKGKQAKGKWLLACKNHVVSQLALHVSIHVVYHGSGELLDIRLTDGAVYNHCEKRDDGLS